MRSYGKFCLDFQEDSEVGESLERPKTLYEELAKDGWWSRKSLACVVQPEVLARG